ncbi:MAG: HNH endonuclease [Cyanobacteriota bacterium]|nr:HNH endonuclease [Cyanobacteriota bacterium]
MNSQSQPENKNLAYYCNRFETLKVDSNKKLGTAPYQPILILSIIDLISQGKIVTPNVTVSEDLVQTFNKYFNILNSSSYTAGGLHYPFYAFQNQGFWKLKFKPDFDGSPIKSTKKLKEKLEYAILEDKLFYFLRNPSTRDYLLSALISAWFPDREQEVLNINQFFQNEMDNIESNEERKFISRNFAVRNVFFRKSVVYAYDYQCAFCQLKVSHSPGQSIVDGAHIKPFSQFYDNNIYNGISFCKNHHWAFDRGWFSIDENYRIIVTKGLREKSPHSKPMKDFHNQKIVLPISNLYLPSLEALQWHRDNIFSF